VRWLTEHELGRATPFGPVPLVPTAVIFDLVGHDAPPGADQGYAACEAAVAGVPERGAIGAGAHAAVGKALGRERATRGGVGYAASQHRSGATVAAQTVANAVGDVIGSDGEVIAGPRDGDGRLLRSAELIPTLDASPEVGRPGENTTLVSVCTDASLDKRGCGIIARMASAGVARAVDPVFSPIDGDVVFCVASGSEPPPAPGLAATWALTALGTVAATVTPEASRDAVAASQPAQPRAV